MTHSKLCSVTRDLMGPHDAHLSYRGEICEEGVTALDRHLDSIFEYYKYNQVNVQLDSPGGSVDAMHYLLQRMSFYEARGRKVVVQSTFMCASAAAVILAMGHWGERRVDKATALLFHSARIERSGAGITAAISSNLSQTLINIDLQLVDMLVKRMISETGGASQLANLMLDRCSRVEEEWDKWSSHLAPPSLPNRTKKRPDWLRTLSKLARPTSDGSRFVSEFKKHLLNRLQDDVRMDVREAYVTALVDGLSGGRGGGASIAKAPSIQPLNLQKGLIDAVGSNTLRNSQLKELGT